MTNPPYEYRFGPNEPHTIENAFRTMKHFRYNAMLLRVDGTMKHCDFFPTRPEEYDALCKELDTNSSDRVPCTVGYLKDKANLWGDNHAVAKSLPIKALANQLVGDQVEGPLRGPILVLSKSRTRRNSATMRRMCALWKRRAQSARPRRSARRPRPKRRPRRRRRPLWPPRRSARRPRPTRCASMQPRARGSTSPRLTPLDCTCCAQSDAIVADFMFDADEAPPRAHTGPPRGVVEVPPSRYEAALDAAGNPAPGTDAFQAAVSQVDAPQTPQGKQPRTRRAPRTSGCTFGKPEVPTPGRVGAAWRGFCAPGCRATCLAAGQTAGAGRARAGARARARPRARARAGAGGVGTGPRPGRRGSGRRRGPGRRRAAGRCRANVEAAAAVAAAVAAAMPVQEPPRRCAARAAFGSAPRGVRECA